LRPEALEALQGCEAILHAGDVGNIEILDSLRTLAPVTAIRGNVDIHGPCAELPETEMLRVGGALVYMLHSVHDLDLDPVAAGVRLVVSGHSHSPSVEERGGVIYLNPGSAGPRRFGLPVSVAIVEIEGEQVVAKILSLLK
jgi:putative phosphoesterase